MAEPLTPEPGAGTPTPTRPQKTPTGREYFVIKTVRAGDVEPDSLVWIELEPVEAEEPVRACDAAAKRDDASGEFQEGAEYLAASRVARKTPKKTVKTSWE